MAGHKTDRSDFSIYLVANFTDISIKFKGQNTDISKNAQMSVTLFAEVVSLGYTLMKQLKQAVLCVIYVIFLILKYFKIHR